MSGNLIGQFIGYNFECHTAIIRQGDKLLHPIKNVIFFYSMFCYNIARYCDVTKI